MNFLAHLLISIDDEQIMVGNFIGDFVKGSQISEFNTKIQKGIRLHRAIDSYTDQHPIVKESKVRLRPKFRHYAPVIVDVFYDHFLAKNWDKYATEPLMDFTNRFYSLMENYSTQVPAGVNHMLTYMRSGNWLYNYQFLEGIHKALSGMSRRTKFQSHMDQATEALKHNYEEFQNEFNRFFPELQAFANTFEK